MNEITDRYCPERQPEYGKGYNPNCVNCDKTKNEINSCPAYTLVKKGELEHLVSLVKGLLVHKTFSREP